MGPLPLAQRVQLVITATTQTKLGIPFAATVETGKAKVPTRTEKKDPAEKLDDAYKRYIKTEKGQIALKKHLNSQESREARKRYSESEAGKAAQLRYRL